MARRHVSEADLLEFRERASELAQTVGEKYEKMDREAKKQEETPVSRETGLLLLPDSRTGTDQFRYFAQQAKQVGFAVRNVDVTGYVPKDRFDRTPEWQRRLDQVQGAYVALNEYARHTVIVGVGDACPLATVLAEQYPVDALVLVGEGPALRFGQGVGRSAERRLCSIAKNNLFSVVCPVLVLSPKDVGPYRPNAAKLFDTCSRSDRVEIEPVDAADASAPWTQKEGVVQRRILEFAGRIGQEL